MCRIKLLKSAPLEITFHTGLVERTFRQGVTYTCSDLEWGFLKTTGYFAKL